MNEDVVAEAEAYVVGACLLQGSAVRDVWDSLSGADFQSRSSGAVFDVVCEMYAQKKPIDTLTVADELDRRGLLAKVGGPVWLAKARSAVPTAANVAYYGKIVADGAARRRLVDFGTRAAQLAGMGDVGEAYAAVRSWWDKLSRAASTRADAKTLGELLSGSDEYDWVIPGLLERTDRLVLTGGEGQGKTTLVRQLVVCAAAGLHPFTFTPVPPVKVLVVDAENTERQWRRSARGLLVQAKARGSEDPSDRVMVVAADGLPKGRLDLTDSRDVALVHRLVDEHEPGILVIGPLYKLVPRAITTDDDAAPLISALDGLRARGLALVMEAHHGHQTDETGQRNPRPRGSAALLGWPEFGLGLRVDRDACDPTADFPTVFELVRWRGDRDQRAWPPRLLRGGAWPWTLDVPGGTCVKCGEPFSRPALLDSCKAAHRPP